MAVGTAKMTVAEYEKLTPPSDGTWELHHGELVKVTRPLFRHSRLQHRLLYLLNAVAGPSWIALVEFAFRPSQEHEIWTADVGMVPQSRTNPPPDKWFTGTPELVIEVLSPSNTMSEMIDRERTCMQGGCKEFWVVEPDLQLVRVSRADGRTATYEIGDDIPLDLLCGGTLSVASIFIE
jgi:Uma2 family endonuclease